MFVVSRCLCEQRLNKTVSIEASIAEFWRERKQNYVLLTQNDWCLNSLSHNFLVGFSYIIFFFVTFSSWATHANLSEWDFRSFDMQRVCECFFGVSFKGTVANNDVRFTHHTHAPCLWLEESKKRREKKRYTQRKTELKNPFAMETMQWYFFFISINPSRVMFIFFDVCTLLFLLARLILCCCYSLCEMLGVSAMNGKTIQHMLEHFS